MYKCVHVIINPVAGQEKPILGTLNSAFHPAGSDWEVIPQSVRVIVPIKADQSAPGEQSAKG